MKTAGVKRKLPPITPSSSRCASCSGNSSSTICTCPKDNNNNIITRTGLQKYYKEHFPAKELFALFSGGLQREWSMKTEECFYRYKSYESSDAFRKDLVRLVPNKLDVGGIYHHEKDMKESSVEKKELVFDVDINDYEDVRTLCGCKNQPTICPGCWPLMTAAVQVVHSSLIEDFGFDPRRIRWVYSGRRGVHCWVHDERAMKLSGHARSDIVDYLSIDHKHMNRLPNPLPPSLFRSFELLLPLFERTYIMDLDLLGKTAGIQHVLSFFPAHRRDALQKTLEKIEGSRHRWEALVKQEKQTKQDESALAHVVLHYMYPRLDAGVTKHLNHLLKAPFTVHPQTGRICVPFDPERSHDFRPWDVPTLTTVLANPSVLTPYLAFI